MTNGTTTTVHFKHERDTKGAVRYHEVTGPNADEVFEVSEGAKIGTLYIRKTAFNGETPQRLVLTIKAT